ncbi:MAG TPA: glycosyltransferase family 2 protein [Vicinamibacterales bacterium]|nr:glycosyltransferase family 2 protein [Vicinamibacterales bacterium]
MSGIAVELSIVIVNWNSQEHLKNCLASIAAHAGRLEPEVVVIDSGSFDGSDRMMAEHYPQMRFIQSSTNLGFAKANNRAFEATSGEAVLFLNPDTELVGPALEILLAALTSRPDAGLVGCRLLDSDGTVQSTCIQSIPTILNQLLGSDLLRRRWPRSRLWGMAALYDDRPGPHEVEAVSGACVLVRRQVFTKVGRFSEDYFMYAEDMDLSYKVRQAGYRNYYVPSATVTHHGGSSSDQAASAFAAVMMREAIWRFLRKTRGDAYALGYRIAMLCAATGRLGLLAASRIGGRNGASRRASWQKWVAVLRWGVRRDAIVNRYYPLSNRPAAETF